MERDERQREAARLAETRDIIQARLAEAAKESEAHTEALRAIQEERMEDRRMDLGGMYSAQGFADLLELSQGAQALSRVTAARESAERTLRTLLRMLDKPYFARIDFRPEGGETREVYIGRATLMDEETMQIYVYDWRVPIASVFYQYGVGHAAYEAPAGTVRGQVQRKRQYEIQRGELLYYFDANEEVRDQFLRELLSRPAAPAMKSIVETIQRDQDRIIRDMEAGLLMVQGAAGSGKTSVALHRVAYLMYQGLAKGRLDPNDILILAPNAAFERYIAQVLPDLGEKQVETLLPEDLLARLLPDAAIQPRGAWTEGLLGEADPERARTLRAARGIKGSAAFARLLDRLVYEIPRKWLPFSDVLYDGQCVATSAWARVSICNDAKKAPLGVRLRMLEKAIWRRVHALRPARQAKLLAFAGQFPHHIPEVRAFARMLSIRESGRLLRQIRAFTRVDCAALYRGAFNSPEAFARLAAGLLPPEALEAVRLSTLEGLDAPALPYEDAAAIAYLEAQVNGCRAYTHLRQVVADEVQDLDALHGMLLKRLFPNARFTLLGDVHQTLGGAADLSLYSALEAALDKRESVLVKLNKSFRCTREIWDFSARFLPPGEAGASFSRSGEKPVVYRAGSRSAQDALLLENARQCLQAGHASVAVLCKTQRGAEALYGRLRGMDTGDLALTGPGESLSGRGVFVLSLYMAKGLEFDAVLLCDVDAGHYRDAGDLGPLYVGCTRALHVLRLFYTGERSPLL